ncbi:MAG: NTP transferase domain-containing protein [Sphingomonadaceae bacterium]
MITKAIILSAGKGSRLGALTTHRPKCLLDIGGKTLLEWQLEALDHAGILEIVVVSGFGDDLVRDVLKGLELPRARVETLFNPFYHVADNLGSVWMARSHFDRDTLLLNGDTLVSPELVARVLADAKSPIAVTIDRKPDYDADDMKVMEVDGRLRRIGKKLQSQDCNAESIGLLAFQGDGPRAFADAVDRALREEDGTARWYLSVIDQLANTLPVHTVSIEGLAWTEVDYPADFEKARLLAEQGTFQRPDVKHPIHGAAR